MDDENNPNGTTDPPSRPLWGPISGPPASDDRQAVPEVRQAWVPPQPPARRNGATIGLVVGAVCLVAVSAVVVVMALNPSRTVAGGPAGVTTQGTYTYTYETSTTTTVPTTTWQQYVTPTTTSFPASGFRTVGGAEGMTIAVPSDWTVGAGAVAANQQATDPTNSYRFIRFGGLASAPGTLLDSITSYESTSLAGTGGYQRISLTPGTVGPGDDSVDWTFDFVKDGAPQRAFGHYWRHDGIDFVAYLSAPVDSWDSMQPVITEMVNSVTPL